MVTSDPGDIGLLLDAATTPADVVRIVQEVLHQNWNLVADSSSGVTAVDGLVEGFLFTAAQNCRRWGAARTSFPSQPIEITLETIEPGLIMITVSEPNRPVLAATADAAEFWVAFRAAFADFVHHLDRLDSWEFESFGASSTSRDPGSDN